MQTRLLAVLYHRERQMSEAERSASEAWRVRLQHWITETTAACVRACDAPTGAREGTTTTPERLRTGTSGNPALELLANAVVHDAVHRAHPTVGQACAHRLCDRAAESCQQRCAG